MSDNWVVQNLENALETWNSKLSEIWQLLTTSPQEFKGGSIWSVMVNINGAVQAIGLALLVLFFVVGVVRTCGSFTDVKKKETGTRIKAVYPLCYCQRCDYLRAGAYACPVRHRTRYDFNHYDICGIRYAQSNNLTC